MHLVGGPPAQDMHWVGEMRKVADARLGSSSGQGYALSGGDAPRDLIATTHWSGGYWHFVGLCTTATTACNLLAAYGF